MRWWLSVLKSSQINRRSKSCKIPASLLKNEFLHRCFSGILPFGIGASFSQEHLLLAACSFATSGKTFLWKQSQNMFFTFGKSLKMAEKGRGLTDKEITTNIKSFKSQFFFRDGLRTCQIYQMELFPKEVSGLNPIVIFAKSSIFDVWGVLIPPLPLIFLYNH